MYSTFQIDTSTCPILSFNNDKAIRPFWFQWNSVDEVILKLTYFTLKITSFYWFLSYHHSIILKIIQEFTRWNNIFQILKISSFFWGGVIFWGFFSIEIRRISGSFVHRGLIRGYWEITNKSADLSIIDDIERAIRC